MMKGHHIIYMMALAKYDVWISFRGLAAQFETLTGCEPLFKQSRNATFYYSYPSAGYQ